MSGEQMDSMRDRLARDWAPTLFQKPMRVDASPAPEEAAAPQTGVMVALMVPLAVANDLALDGGEPADQLHITLAFLGDIDAVGDREDELIQVVQEWATKMPALAGDVAGKGMFTNGPTPVTYATVDVPGLDRTRASVVQALQQAGFKVSHAHGFTPHITLAYANRLDADVPTVHLAFDAAVVGYGGSYTGCPFGAPVEPEPAAVEEDVAPALVLPVVTSPTVTTVAAPESIIYNGVPPYTTSGSSTTNLMFGAPTQEARESVEVPDGKAFLTEISGRTVLTAPASTFAPTWEKALTPNKHFLWMQGRFVGAETPNRNNAFWSSQDLELGQTTVAHGPLNWLHEARHVIGTIADARYVPAAAGALGQEAAASTVDPHITAASAIWRWIYPDEAWVVEQASDSGKLWYSMECISETVACVGEGSCGTEVGYAGYMQGLGCQHMQERSAVRRFVDPTFLGGAVIVPPVRPGWADADATVLGQAASLAERAFDQAGHPDISASDWEQLMAQVVRYAKGA